MSMEKRTHCKAVFGATASSCLGRSGSIAESILQIATIFLSKNKIKLDEDKQKCNDYELFHSVFR